MSGYITKRISNYEGFARLDKLLEKVETGKLKGPREPAKDHLCAICKTRKRSVNLIRSELIGVPVSQLPGEVKVAFQGRFVLGCDECNRMLEAAGVAGR